MKKGNKNKRKESVQIFCEFPFRTAEERKERGGGKQIGRDCCKTYTSVFLGVEAADWFSLYVKKMWHRSGWSDCKDGKESAEKYQRDTLV